MSKLDIVDFHTHFLPEGWEVYRAPGRPLDPLWARIGTKISDIDALIADSDAAGISRRVIGVALSIVAAPDADLGAVSRKLNDDLAAMVARHPDRLFALATVDTFGGEAAAVEARRAIVDLNLSGLFLDSARGDRLIDAPEARPILRVAAELGVPVFLHPINPEPLSTQLSGLGRLGTRLSRGAINAAAAISLVTSGVFDELPDRASGRHYGARHFGTRPDRPLRRTAVHFRGGASGQAASPLYRHHAVGGTLHPLRDQSRRR